MLQTKSRVRQVCEMTVRVVGGMPIYTERGVVALWGVAVTNAAAVTMTTDARAGKPMSG